MKQLAVIDFTVPFVAGLDRSRVTKVNGRIQQYDPPKNRANKAVIRALYEDACNSKYGSVLMAQKGVPVTVLIQAFQPLPKSRPKRTIWEPFTSKPDADNIVKLVLDSLNRVAFHDDAQVTDVNARKQVRMRGIHAHTDVTISFYVEDEID